MAIVKQYSHDTKVCQVTFTLSKEFCENFMEISVVGEFNNWDYHQHKFSQRNADGSMSMEIVLDTGKEYQFRYLCDGVTWVNEPDADKQVPTPYGDSENSVIII
ncbi:MAG: isoamylase early set domain-containing protein [Bacteroidota bacterium]|jgi:1,4-alpha-glucan branching enzyme